MTKTKRKLSKRKAPTIPQAKVFRGQAFDTSSSYAEGIPMDSKVLDLIDAYKLHPWVYAALFQIASNFASIDYTIYKMAKDGSLAPDDKNPFNVVIKRPNPFMSFLDVKEFTSLSLESIGNAYWGLEKTPGGVVYELWPLPPTHVEAVSSKEKLIDHYVLDVNGNKIRYELDELIHFKYASPLSFVYGQGSLTAARNIIVTDLLAEKWNQVFFKNSGRPDAVIETEGSLQAADRKRMLTAWKQLYSGAQNARKVAILENKSKYVPIVQNHADMEFLELRKLAREQVLASIGVPPSIVGILEYANYSNVKEQNQMFWKYTMVPKVRKVESTLTMKLNELQFRTDLVVKADLSQVEALRTDEIQRSAIVRRYWDMGVPFNTLIDTFDLPFEPIPGGDEPKPTPLTTGGGGISGDANPDPASNKALESIRKQLEHKPAEITKAHPKPEMDLRWKKFDRELSRREESMRLRMSSFFSSQKKRVLSNLEKNADAILAGHVSKAQPTVEISMLFNTEEEQRLMKRAAEKHIKGTYFDFAIAAAKEADPSFDFNLQDPKALHWIENKVIKLVTEANRYTKETISENVVDAIEEAVAEGFDKSETIAQISQRINDVYQFATEGRADRIARTEIISASNAGTVQGLKETGAKTKEWVSVRDDRTRDTHKALDGTVVNLDEDFVSDSGEHLSFPGDPNAAPEEIINCRCTVASGD